MLMHQREPGDDLNREALKAVALLADSGRANKIEELKFIRVYSKRLIKYLKSLEIPEKEL